MSSPPWRDVIVTSCCLFNINEAGAIKFSPCIPGLGQGFVGTFGYKISRDARYWSLPARHRLRLQARRAGMLDKTSNRSFLFIKNPASSIQHHFASSNGIMILLNLSVWGKASLGDMQKNLCAVKCFLAFRQFPMHWLIRITFQGDCQ